MSLLQALSGLILGEHKSPYGKDVPKEVSKNWQILSDLARKVSTYPVYWPIADMLGVQRAHYGNPTHTLDQGLELLGRLAVVSDDDVAKSLMVRLASLKGRLLSDEYDCPICTYINRRGDDVGRLTLDWDFEHDDMGYPVSSWPIFDGECRDNPIPMEFRGNSRTRILYSNEVPFLHCEILNRASREGETGDGFINGILGEARERRRIRELLGLEVPRWGRLEN